MRRGSLTPMASLGQEPLIVVEESGCLEEDEPHSVGSSPRQSLDIDSPQNPYLLSPWRDPRETRKHSLPTPSCTTGITASQVRRLSEQGGEGSGPSAREAAFLATLSTAPAPQPGGRRHSVVTISRVPPAFFGRGRRESVAAVPYRNPKGGPPTTDRRGSSHNLQLDIMDDIVTARKVRMRLWNTSDERMCEVQPMDETDPRTPQRYTHAGRRFSDFVGCALPTIPAGRRRASELPSRPPIPPRAKDAVEGIVCSNTDLISILSTLTSSATEINRCDEKMPLTKADFNKKAASTLESRRNRLKNSRSNSFDASVLNAVNRQMVQGNDKTAVSPSSWFIKRHQTLANKKGEQSQAGPTGVAFAKEALRHTSAVKSENANVTIPKVIWDKPSGSMVDAQVLGSAIEVFLRQTGAEAPPTTLQPPTSSNSLSASQGAIPKVKLDGRSPQSGWYSGKSEEEDSADTCDTSLCSTLKDLFVK